MMQKMTTKNLYLLAEKSKKAENKLDYYLMLNSGMRRYAFTRNFSTSCYDILKKPVHIDNVLYGRSRNPAFMKLVKYLKHIMPYLMEYMSYT